MRHVPVVIKRVRGWPLPNWAIAKVPARRLMLWRASVPFTKPELAHELAHVTQAERHRGWPLPYIIQWMAHGFSYRRMPFEVEARKAASEPFYLSWAKDIMEDNA